MVASTHDQTSHVPGDRRGRAAAHPEPGVPAGVGDSVVPGPGPASRGQHFDGAAGRAGATRPGRGAWAMWAGRVRHAALRGAGQCPDVSRSRPPAHRRGLRSSTVDRYSSRRWWLRAVVGMTVWDAAAMRPNLPVPVGQVVGRVLRVPAGGCRYRDDAFKMRVSRVRTDISLWYAGAWVWLEGEDLGQVEATRRFAPALVHVSVLRPCAGSGG